MHCHHYSKINSSRLFFCNIFLIPIHYRVPHSYVVLLVQYKFDIIFLFCSFIRFVSRYTSIYLLFGYRSVLLNSYYSVLVSLEFFIVLHLMSRYIIVKTHHNVMPLLIFFFFILFLWLQHTCSENVFLSSLFLYTVRFVFQSFSIFHSQFTNNHFF